MIKTQTQESRPNTTKEIQHPLVSTESSNFTERSCKGRYFTITLIDKIVTVPKTKSVFHKNKKSNGSTGLTTDHGSIRTVFTGYTFVLLVKQDGGSIYFYL